MKVAVVFVLLFATVLCRPARKVSLSSESSEEVVKQPAVPQTNAAPEQIFVAAAAAGSDESTESSDEDEATAQTPLEVISDSADTTSSSDTASVTSNSQDSEDSDDDDDEAESETEEDDDDSSQSSESGESSTVAPATLIPVIVTEEPVAETTSDPILPSIVTDTDSGRGDSLGGYPSDYKSIVYVEDKSYHKVPAPYKSYEYVGTGKKMAYDMTDGNEVEKTLTVYKALQVHSDLLEEDTSTPEVENQGLDGSQDQEISPRQASLPEESTSTSDASTSDATTSESESSSAPEETEEEESASTASDSASTSQESEDEESQSSEEATATPGAADSESDESDSTESDSDEEGAGPNTATDMPAVITAK